jgi:murein DD-endopeptidase MepM/ murein hydrolase activator NlpD
VAVAAVVAVVAVVAATFAGSLFVTARAAAAGEPASTVEARALQTIDARQMILATQVDMARRTARWRARELYRVLRAVPAAAGNGGALSDAVRARAVAVGARALGRELAETRVLAVELAQARAERETIQAAGAVNGETPSRAPAPPPPFVMPLLGPGRLVSRFGAARDPATGLSLIQAGVRIDAPIGASVGAAAAGTVQRVAPTPAGGLAVLIDHGGGWTSVLTGLAAVEAEPGQRIGAARRLGRVAPAPPGAAGGITLELWRGRVAVDPARYIHLPPR